MDAYILIGEGESAKSSVTRCLTGSGSSRTRLIATLSIDVKVYVRLISLQEDKKKIKPEDFELVLKEETCDAVLLSLRPRSGNGCPDADAYLKYFNDLGWHILRVACFDIPASTIATPLPHGTIRTFPRITETTPVNQVAAQVRRYFGWV